MACSLDGTFGIILLSTGVSVWTKQTSSPIFSNPCKLSNLNRIIIAEVVGVVHCIDFDGDTVKIYVGDSRGIVGLSFASVENQYMETKLCKVQKLLKFI